MDELLLSDIRTGVRGLLTDTAYDASLIDQAANWVIYSLFATYRLRMAESSDTMTTSINDTTVDFPADMLTWIDIYQTVPTVMNMRSYNMPYKTFMGTYANFATATAAQVGQWTEYGKAMRFATPLSAAATFQIDYLRTPETMEDDGDVCEISRIYEELICKLTLARIMEINEDYAEASQERDNIEPLLTTFVRNEGRGGGKIGPNLIPSNRSGRMGWRVDRDF